MKTATIVILGLAVFVAFPFAAVAAEEGSVTDKPARQLDKADADADGKITFDEAAKARPGLTRERFDRLDRNKDGAIARDEFRGARRDRASRSGRGGRQQGRGQGHQGPPPWAQGPKQGRGGWQQGRGQGHQGPPPWAHGPQQGRGGWQQGRGQGPQGPPPWAYGPQQGRGRRGMDRGTRQGPPSSREQASADRGPQSRGPQGPPPHVIEEIRKADADGNGEVTFDEATAMRPGIPREVFDRFDKNNDGVVSRADMQ